ncbi:MULTISPECIES: hypothetical protein [Halostella]|uniref:DUF7576 family protein n=1 Tax=Halostella TaxID=1843185 RepID=UPI00108031CE|nr:MULTISPECIES: hypothetical protein [Halostella]
MAENVRQVSKSERVECVSTRIQLTENSTTCDGCGESIEQRVQYKYVTVQGSSGRFTEFSFCDEDCFGETF